MNETINTIMNRRSIRQYKSQQIEEDQLNTILKTGMYAPNPVNRQSSFLMVLQKEKLINELVSITKEVTGKDKNPYHDAPTIVFVYVKEDNKEAIKSACLAIENMFLAAASLGIGSCWVNSQKLFASEKGKEFKKKLRIDEEYEIVASFVLGYPDLELPKPAPHKEYYYTIIE
ncbi:MAG: nitroreductase family protein [Bacillus sp. (in: firmicutes)]